MSDAVQLAADAATFASNRMSALERRIFLLEANLVLTMRRQGMYMKDIAKATDIDYELVRTWCRNHGL